MNEEKNTNEVVETNNKNSHISGNTYELDIKKFMLKNALEQENELKSILDKLYEDEMISCDNNGRTASCINTKSSSLQPASFNP